MSAATLAVKFAAWTLPKRIRPRYREQWLADLRDAEEAGLQPAEIALGSLAFAATLSRPFVARVRLPREVIVQRRTRLASALALSCAAIGLSQFVGVGGSHSGLSGNGVYDFSMFLNTAVMFLYVAISPLVALGFVATTREMATSVRWAVCLLILASVTGVAYLLIESSRAASTIENIYLTPGTASYAVALALSVVAGALLIRHFHGQAKAPAVGRRPFAGIVGGAVSLAAVGLGLANLQNVRLHLHNADLVMFETMPNEMRDQAERFAELLANSDQATMMAVVVWGVAAASVSVVIAVAGFFQPRHAVPRTLALLCGLMISHAGVLTLVWLYSFGGPGVHLAVPEELLLLVGRWGLVAIILYAVGGLRLTRRHSDVEGTIPRALPWAGDGA